MEKGLIDDLWTRGGAHVIAVGALVDVARQHAAEIDAPDIEQWAFNGNYSASIHLLIGFAFELLLKSAYLLSGGDKANLSQRGIGQDLIKAFDSAEELGFRSDAENLRSILEYLREPHLKHYFRYGGPAQIAMPDLDATLVALHTLAGELQIQLANLP